MTTETMQIRVTGDLGKVPRRCWYHSGKRPHVCRHGA
jgi:hypothetical protein